MTPAPLVVTSSNHPRALSLREGAPPTQTHNRPDGAERLNTVKLQIEWDNGKTRFAKIAIDTREVKSIEDAKGLFLSLCASTFDWSADRAWVVDNGIKTYGMHLWMERDSLGEQHRLMVWEVEKKGKQVSRPYRDHIVLERGAVTLPHSES